ncbi:MAG: LytR/AlgR family response regulator transcription factor [Burkholderiaceae bacterium]
MTTALIADDEEHLRTYLQGKLALLWPDLQIVAQAKNGIEAAKLIEQHAPDVAFLDIKMPGLTGLEVAKGIEADTRVVFVTAYDEFAVEAFEREAVDYVLKPVTDERLGKTIARIKKALVEHAPSPDLSKILNQLTRALPASLAAGGAAAKYLRWIRASRGDTTFQVPVEEVLYFQSDDKYTVVQTSSGAEHLIRTPLADLGAELDPENFWQIHRSTIVNMQHVTATRREESGKLFVKVKGHDKELVVSRAYVHLFRQM